MAGERTSCIVHPAQVRTNVLREEYLGICQAAPNTHCAAMLLSMFEHWTNFKWQEREEIERKNENAKQNGKPTQKVPSLWVFMSQVQMKAELFGLFGETVIMKAVAWLREVGLIKTRENRIDKWDRTLQYLLKINVLQQAVTWWLASSYAPRRAVTASRPYKKAIETVKIRHRDRKNTQAIPQGLSQGQSQGGESTPAPIAEEPKSSHLPPNAINFDAFKPVTPAMNDTIAFMEAQKYMRAYEDAFPPTAPIKVPNSHTNRETAMFLLKAGYNPDDVTELVKQKIASGRKSYPFAWLQTDMSEFLRAREKATSASNILGGLKLITNDDGEAKSA